MKTTNMVSVTKKTLFTAMATLALVGTGVATTSTAFSPAEVHASEIVDGNYIVGGTVELPVRGKNTTVTIKITGIKLAVGETAIVNVASQAPKGMVVSNSNGVKDTIEVGNANGKLQLFSNSELIDARQVDGGDKTPEKPAEKPNKPTEKPSTPATKPEAKPSTPSTKPSTSVKPAVKAPATKTPVQDTKKGETPVTPEAKQANDDPQTGIVAGVASAVAGAVAMVGAGLGFKRRK